MNEKKEISASDNLIGISVLLVIAFFISRSNFYTYESVGFFKSFFVTNMVYSRGEEVRGAPGALAYLRSMMYFIFPALLWTVFSAKNEFNTYVLFLTAIGVVVVKIILDYVVFGGIMNIRGGISFIKIIITAFIFFCIYECIKRIQFTES